MRGIKVYGRLYSSVCATEFFNFCQKLGNLCQKFSNFRQSLDNFCQKLGNMKG